MKDFEIVKAKPEDTETVLRLIKELAVYEKMLEQVIATPELIRESLFGKNSNAEAVIAYYNNKPVGIAIYFFNFSTFVGRRGLYLEDLFVIPEMRGKGFGKSLLIYLAKVAKENNCGRFEWAVLNWNEPAINFYKSLGAVPMNEWTVYRLEGEPLEILAGEK
jgi:GNAT superfamily N-acetyltransferase